MLTELHRKGGCLCKPAREGELHCPLIVRPTSEDVITGHLVQALRGINARWWLPDLLNEALGTTRFRRQVYRRLRIEPWINQQRLPRDIIPWAEGSTQVDIGIFWENPPTTVFIEAKYGSDLARTTSQGNSQSEFATDQLIRNIRVGLHACGYFESPSLLPSPVRRLAVILLTPAGRHPLVEAYRNTNRLMSAIPGNHPLKTLPIEPFVGQITYRQIEGILSKQVRWLNRSERVTAETLATYLSFKRSRRQTSVPGEHQSLLPW